MSQSDPSFGRVWDRLTAHMSPPVFFGAAFVVVVFVVAGAFFTAPTAAFFDTLQRNISRYFGWYYVLLVAVLLLFCAALVITKMRKVRLGGRDATPDFALPGWFAMLFAAGMGIGIVFWGVAEPLLHFADPLWAEPRSQQAVREAVTLSYFHWGLHAWAIYAVLALAIAYAHFNKHLPLAPRSVLYPLIGRRIEGPIGHATDILCTVGTLLGVATSLGLGAMQINVSLAGFTDLPQTPMIQSAIIAAITGIATISVLIGLSGGIQRLSIANIALASLLLIFVLIAGPTLYLLEIFTSSLGSYLQNLPKLTFFLQLGDGSEWQATWTLFYWGWWISWSPFVAVFVARISRGRTVGEFIAGTLLVPSIAVFLWFAVFGGAALNLQEGGIDLVGPVETNVAASLQALMSELPLTGISLTIATLVVLIFFVTSSDSGSFVDDMVTAGGDPNPPKPQRVFWAVSEGAVAICLLLLGGLQPIRNAAITFGLPMSLLLIAAMVALVKMLRQDPMSRLPDQ